MRPWHISCRTVFSEGNRAHTHATRWLLWNAQTQAVLKLKMNPISGTTKHYIKEYFQGQEDNMEEVCLHYHYLCFWTPVPLPKDKVIFYCLGVAEPLSQTWNGPFVVSSR